MLLTESLLWLVLGSCGLVLILLLNSLLHNVETYAKAYVTQLLRRLPQRFRQQLHKAAQLAGYADDTSAFVMEQSAMLLAALLSFVLPLPHWLGPGVCLLIMVSILRKRMQLRMAVRSFEKQWPNCLDMLAMLMRAGLSFPAALQNLAQLPSSVIALRHLRQLNQQLKAGVPLDDALTIITMRMPSKALVSFAAAVLQARKSGAALTETLMLQAEQARKEQQLAAEKFAQEVGVKLLLPLVTCFFPVTFLLILGPVFIGYF